MTFTQWWTITLINFEVRLSVVIIPNCVLLGIINRQTVIHQMLLLLFIVLESIENRYYVYISIKINLY